MGCRQLFWSVGGYADDLEDVLKFVVFDVLGNPHTESYN